MLRVYLVKTMAGWQAIFGKQILCTKSTRAEAQRSAKAEMGALGYWMNRIQFV